MATAVKISDDLFNKAKILKEQKQNKEALHHFRILNDNEPDFRKIEVKKNILLLKIKNTAEQIFSKNI